MLLLDKQEKNMEKEKKPETIVRYSPPNKYDEAPFLTRCIVLDKEKNRVYVQMSKNTQEPRWELMS